MAHRHIIIGDVHGMLFELKALLHAAKADREDILVLVGDLVDKGPDSAGVVKYVRELREDGYFVKLVKGNHEDKHERFRRAFAKAGDKVKMKGIEELKAITTALSQEDIDFLETAQLKVEVPGGVAVHAGILPTMETLDLEALGKKADMLMRVRHVTGKTVQKYTVEFTVEGDDTYNIPALVKAARSAVPIKSSRKEKGSFITLGKEKPEDPFWADVYDGRFGTVYFGHSPYIEAKEPVEFPHAVGLDLGAVFGNRLAAAIVQPDASRTYVSVPATDKFCKSFWED